MKGAVKRIRPQTMMIEAITYMDLEYDCGKVNDEGSLECATLAVLGKFGSCATAGAEQVSRGISHMKLSLSFRVSWTRW